MPPAVRVGAYYRRSGSWRRGHHHCNTVLAGRDTTSRHRRGVAYGQKHSFAPITKDPEQGRKDRAQDGHTVNDLRVIPGGFYFDIFILHITSHKRLITAAQRNLECGTIQKKTVGVYMCKEELKLISYGFPLSEAVGMVARLRRDGMLEEFIAEQERIYQKECERIAQEAVG